MISVCIATYNGQTYIREQVNSILNQLTETDEIIISDNNSSDSTLEVLKSINDERLKIYSNMDTRNPMKNFEFALSLAKGEYIFLADQDDVWLDNKVSLSMKLLQDYDCIVHDAYIVNKGLKKQGNNLFQIYNSKKGKLKNIIRNSYVGCCMAFNRKVLEKALPFPSQLPMHDSWIGLIAEKYGKVYFVNTPLIYYRRHQNNVSMTGESSVQGLPKKILDRYYLLSNLLKR